MANNLKSRLNRLEAKAGNCADAVVVLLFHYDGEEPPPIPAEPRCRQCGQVHAIIVRIVCVSSGPTGGNDGH
jgi:hypothetical protein